jgi:hypothetical protein
MSDIIELVWRLLVSATFLYAAHLAWWWRRADRPTIQPPRINLAVWLTGQGIWYALLALAAPMGSELDPWWTGTSRVLNTGLAIAIAIMVKVRNGNGS